MTTNSAPARTLTVTVHEARGLPALDEYASNPYVSLLVGASQKRETKVAPGDTEPEWQQAFSFDVDDALAAWQSLRLRVLNSHYLRRDQLMCEASLPLYSLRGGPWWCGLELDGARSGALSLSFAWSPEPPPVPDGVEAFRMAPAAKPATAPAAPAPAADDEPPLRLADLANALAVLERQQPPPPAPPPYYYPPPPYGWAPPPAAPPPHAAVDSPARPANAAPLAPKVHAKQGGGGGGGEPSPPWRRGRDIDLSSEDMAPPNVHGTALKIEARRGGLSGAHAHAPGALDPLAVRAPHGSVPRMGRRASGDSNSGDFDSAF